MKVFGTEENVDQSEGSATKDGHDLAKFMRMYCRSFLRFFPHN